MSIEVRPLAEADLASADRVFRVSFGTEFGLPRPETFRGESELVRPRWRAQPDGAFGAFRDGELVGSSFSTRWGSFGIFGPISVRPDCWDAGIGKRLLESAMAAFDRWQVRQCGLFTFAQSPRHAALYQKFGFWPQHLTAVMAKPFDGGSTIPSDLGASVAECRGLTERIFPGLDAGGEIESVRGQGMGEVVAVRDHGALQGFAICHIGKTSEAGNGTLFVKFAAGHSLAALDRLLVQCEMLAAARRAQRLIVGVNTARREAYRLLLSRGYRSFLHGVAMQRPDGAGFNRADAFVLDDWR